MRLVISGRLDRDGQGWSGDCIQPWKWHDNAIACWIAKGKRLAMS